MTISSPRIGICMGSQSDWVCMRHAADILDQLQVTYETRIISAHRTPDRLKSYTEQEQDNGIQVIIAGAGGAANLPGMLAAYTTIPVMGVPVESKALKGMDSLLSIVQMPAGVPVASFSIGHAGATNAGLMAASIVAVAADELSKRLTAWRQNQTDAIADSPVDDN